MQAKQLPNFKQMINLKPMKQPDMLQSLTAYCRKTFGKKEDVTDLARLSGGASMESWSFRYNDDAMVLRRLPLSMSNKEENLRAVSLATQADLIEVAESAGVTVPKILGRLVPEDDLGDGFVMAKVAGETLPHKILGNPKFAEVQNKLTQECARELSRIHSIDLDGLPGDVETFSAAQLIRLQKDKYQELGGKIPLFDYVFHWLEENIPAEGSICLNHADFRMGNLMIDREGITGVLDWEIVHIGDPVKDLAYLCTPSWRFGNYEKVAGGFDSAEALINAYEKESGRTVDPERFQFWLIYCTLWWGIACMVMGGIWRSGEDRSLERTVIGRRVSEVEIDLALLIEPMLPGDLEQPLSWKTPELETSSGETQYEEVLRSLVDWVKKDIQPEKEGRALFETRVAANALGIARRHAAWGSQFSAAAEHRLSDIGEQLEQPITHDQFCEALGGGKLAIDSITIWNHLRISALERLSVDQPKYAGLHAALKKWAGNAG